MLKIDHPTHPNLFSTLLGGEGGLRDNQEVLETILEQGKQYKKPFCTSKVITLISVPTNFDLHCSFGMSILRCTVYRFRRTGGLTTRPDLDVLTSPLGVGISTCFELLVSTSGLSSCFTGVSLTGCSGTGIRC